MLKELFETNRNIVINTDIDGFLCGMILQKYYDCKVVGFSDSHDTVWISPEFSDIDSPIYIDIYVARQNVTCIDQHIIAFNKEHHDTIKSYGTKFNPNLDRCRTFVGDMDSDYFHKYPFGTVHYIIALMASEGIHVEFPDLEKSHIIKDPDNNEHVTNAGHVIMRADDALYSTLSRYRDNALDWWNWLDPEHKSPCIKSLCQFIDSCNQDKAREYKDSIGRFFMALGCDKPDGAFDTITDVNGTILPKVLNYRDVISRIVGMSLDIPERFVIHKGRYGSSSCRSSTRMGILKNKRLYSYAFIRGPHSENNFSFTFDME